jgi:hypothetical protein
MNNSAQIVSKTKSSIPKKEGVGRHSSDRKTTIGSYNRQNKFQHLNFHEDETTSYVLGYN